jgi:predicted Zn-dependent protease with MMP-like domain
MPEMSMTEFKRIVREVMATMPDEIRPYLDNVVVEVDDWPDDDLLRNADFTEEEIEAGETLFGLFDPFPLPEVWSGDSVDAEAISHRLWIFKGPLEEEFPDPKRLRTEIKKTVVHELAHHFGWTDRDLERFDDNPDPFGKGP